MFKSVRLVRRGILATRICKTGELKRGSAFDLSRPALAVSVGAVHFVSFQLRTPNGLVGLSDNDLRVALQYLEKAVGPINGYCSAYGDAAISVDPTIIPFTADLAGATTYTDAELRDWVQTIVQEQNYGAGDALVFFNPPSGVENSDAPVSQGVLGYHGAAPNPYSFVNAIGTGFTVDDAADVYATALSHEIAEMVVDPAADNSKPEVCDPCAGNCNVDYRNYFDDAGNWIQGSPAPATYSFFTDGVATPGTVSQCPAPIGGCEYSPQGAPPSPPSPPSPPGPQPSPCIGIIEQAVAELKAGELTHGFEDLVSGIECLITSGAGDRKKLVEKLLNPWTEVRELDGDIKRLIAKL